MGLFKKSYIKKIKDISERLEEVSLSEDDLILNFRSKVKEIEGYDIEFIRLLQRLSREGHLSEKMKRALLNQLLFLLRRLEKLKFESHYKLNEIKSEIEAFLELELTSERIGIKINIPIYHGSGIANIRSFHHKAIDYEIIRTLGYGLYCTGSKKMAINYSNYRYWYCLNEPEIKAMFGRNVQRTVYTILFKRNRNYVADLSDPIKLRTIYKDLRDFCLQKQPTAEPQIFRLVLSNFSKFLEEAIRKKELFINIHDLLEKSTAFGPTKSAIFYISDFLKSIGYHGLRCKEYGEPEESIYPWEPSMSYVIFNPEDIEIIKEDHYKLVNDKIIQTK